MRYATPTRSAHRATPAGAVALLVRHPIGQHRYHPGPRARSPRRARRDPRQTVHLLTRGLAALIVLGIVVMLGVLIVADERRAVAPATGSAAEAEQRIASRTTDPRPLSETEVFPAGSPSFRAARTDRTADCTLAVTGALRRTLQRYGCSEAVRAALTVPYADYRVTAGVLNLPDAASAVAVGDQVRALVEADDGNFTGLAGEQAAAGTPVGWRTRGHYLMYCLITGPDGEPLPGDDSQVQRITTELLDTHLSESVLARRAT